ncbi:hypothetical protein V6N12_060115 [Hibiscus sabdariffa]|uniref:Uncharacterized protein n=1 Tax=Hibiscus sabdariffa TaxID=183260 RepID=A0ABR2D3W9_9ROSI
MMDYYIHGRVVINVLRLSWTVLEAVNIVNSVSVAMQESAMDLSIKKRLTRDWQVGVYHVGGICNRVADRMTAKGCGSLLTTTIFSVAPDDIRNLIEEELQQSTPASDILVRGRVVSFDPGGKLGGV